MHTRTDDDDDRQSLIDTSNDIAYASAIIRYTCIIFYYYYNCMLSILLFILQRAYQRYPKRRHILAYEEDGHRKKIKAKINYAADDDHIVPAYFFSTFNNKKAFFI